MRHRPRKILIVEDSPTMCQLYRMVLGNLPGSELVFASNGVEGLDRVAQETGLDLMIVDINMPQMDGLEFLRRVRTDFPELSIPSIVISSEGSSRDRDAALAAGGSAYLRKPWTGPQLLAALDALTPQTEPR